MRNGWAGKVSVRLVTPEKYAIMSNGTVKFFNQSKGFGFITPDDGSKDVFVHANDLNVGSINEGDKVTYEVEESQKGFNAVNVSMAE